MNARMETIRRLAESDPYWRGYVDGMTAAHHDNSAAHEYARLAQARLDRERVMARSLGLPYPARLDVDPR